MSECFTRTWMLDKGFARIAKIQGEMLIKHMKDKVPDISMVNFAVSRLM